MDSVLADADLAAVAELMTTHRATLLLALIGGGDLSASELGARAGISPSLTSSHLAKLLDGGLVTVEQRGRQRHYRLASPHVAEVLEAMLTLAPQRQAISLRESNRGQVIAYARTCYDHLAGVLGVTLIDALQHQHIVEPTDNSYQLTPAGQQRLRAFGLDIEQLRRCRRVFARQCLDWTERRPHLAGALGAAIADQLLELGWIRRIANTRAIRITDTGRKRLRDEFAINLPEAR